LGGRCERLVLVGCEPGTFGSEDEGAMGLSAPVAAGVDEAVPAIEALIGELLDQERSARNMTVNEGDHDVGGPR
jgi:hydrogenase maturation protease